MSGVCHLKILSRKGCFDILDKTVTYKSLRLFSGRKASSWISDMLFFSMSLKMFEFWILYLNVPREGPCKHWNYLNVPKFNELILNFCNLKIHFETFILFYNFDNYALTRSEDSAARRRHSLTRPWSCSWNAKHWSRVCLASPRYQAVFAFGI